MRRRLGRAVIILSLLVLAVVILAQFRLQVLTPAALALRSPAPPEWTDQDCARVQRVIEGIKHRRATKNNVSLSKDEIAIYRAVLKRRIEGGWSTLNISNRTYPLTSSNAKCECFQGIEVESLTQAFNSYRHLTRETLPATTLRLVDPNRYLDVVRRNDPHRTIAQGRSVDDAVEKAFKTGLLWISEIAFDKEHQRALVSYAFVCGGLCGSGATLMLEKVDGEWKVSDRDCGGWVS